MGSSSSIVVGLPLREEEAAIAAGLPSCWVYSLAESSLARYLGSASAPSSACLSFPLMRRCVADHSLRALARRPSPPSLEHLPLPNPCRVADGGLSSDICGARGGRLAVCCRCWRAPSSSVRFMDIRETVLCLLHRRATSSGERERPLGSAHRAYWALGLPGAACCSSSSATTPPSSRAAERCSGEGTPPPRGSITSRGPAQSSSIDRRTGLRQRTAAWSRPALPAGRRAVVLATASCGPPSQSSAAWSKAAEATASQPCSAAVRRMARARLACRAT
mmetsp:Transcript_16555/g.46200  ORF Transcript_16555/g.46200 Transcript_16555/m.46200 type:complete len:277 (+) Transcript_16555:519-1349(+)